ncbi:serendipity locus protein alpha [Metopolophium dirhodum]|uniref:serendipity locus protein alpha n=1 Tax=Metopolophium dirhodum TaxID=44670 RepID=UPI0029904B90|nr:serendipity locus protein alpha [Metopolophium dirhodum]
MDDLYFKINIVLNECSRYLCNFEKKEFHEYKIIFIELINGPLLQFVKSIQVFLKTFKNKNVYMLCVCLSQIQKCLLLYETTISEQNKVLNFEKVLSMYIIKRIQKCFYKLEDCLEMIDLTDVDEHPGKFIDQMNIVLNALSNRDHFELIKSNINKILFQAITIAKVADTIDNLEITSSSKHVLTAIQQFEKININETDSFFRYDYLSSSLSILERRINTSVLHLIFKIFNDPFLTIKKLIKKCADSVDTQLRSSSDLHNMICDLDKYTDILIQIGLFSVACCKNDEYVIPLKSCISSLELLDSDMVPAIIEFYLDPTSLVKKTFLKLLINHWVCEICEIQNLLDKIVDPYAFIQTTIETSMNIIDTIQKSDPNANMDLYVYLLNGMNNFSKFIEKIFTLALSENKELSMTYKQYKNALREYNACLIYNQKTSHSYNDSTKNQLLKRCAIVIKYLKNIQTIISDMLEDKSLSELENTYYILSKTKQSSLSLLQNDDLDNNDDLNLLLTTIQGQKSFYNKSERKISNKLCHQDYNCLPSTNETTYDNIVTMDLTNILDNFIHESFNMNKDNINKVNIWEEIGIDTPTRIQDLEDVDNKIISVKKCC